MDNQPPMSDEEYERLSYRRNRVGQVLHGEEWANGHDYDEYEQTLYALAELLPNDDDLILRQDGNMWMCVHGNFVNLQESPSWWGETPAEALAAFNVDTLLTTEADKNALDAPAK